MCTEWTFGPTHLVIKLFVPGEDAQLVHNRASDLWHAAPSAS